MNIDWAKANGFLSQVVQVYVQHLLQLCFDLFQVITKEPVSSLQHSDFILKLMPRSCFTAGLFDTSHAYLASSCAVLYATELC